MLLWKTGEHWRALEEGVGEGFILVEEIAISPSLARRMVRR